MRSLIIIASIIIYFHPALYTQGFVNIAKEINLDFGYSTDEYGGGVSFADFNNDGWDDLSFATPKGKELVFFRNDSGSFTKVSPFVDNKDEVKQILWVDFNNDGHLDLFLASEQQNKLYLNDGALNFSDVTTQLGFDFPELTTYSSTWFDYNKDGYLDLCVAHRTASHNGFIDLYLNHHGTWFEKITAQAGLNSKGESVLSMTILDYNNDGWDDIFLAQDWEKGNQLFENQGNGIFKDVSSASGINYEMNSMTATTPDFNNDGWDDIYVTNTTQGNKLLINEQNGHFKEVSSEYGLDLRNVTFGAIFFDADNDMDLDVHIGGMLSNFTFEQIDSNGTFVKRNLNWMHSIDNDFNNGVAMGDFNNDGKVDFAKNSVIRQDFIQSTNSLWLNQFSGNHFIKVELNGTISNSKGIGSRIKIYVDNGRFQLRRIACGESFSSQHSYIQHFGLGSHLVIDSLIVNWASGNTSKLYNVSADQLVTIEEPPGGCMDITACNFHPGAMFDIGNCRYSEDYFDCNGCISDEDSDGICDELEIPGCMDPKACNYNMVATNEDGSCSYLPVHNIIGNLNPEALKEENYSYTGLSESSYHWSAKNGSVIFGQGTMEATILWHEEGEAQLSVIELSSGNCIGDTVSISLSVQEGIQKNEERPLKIHPNPSTDIFNISGLEINKTYKAQLFDESGRMIGQYLLDNVVSKIDIEAYDPGIYYLRILSENETTIKKLVKI